MHAGDDGLERSRDDRSYSTTDEDRTDFGRCTEFDLVLDLRSGEEERIGDGLLWGLEQV